MSIAPSPEKTGVKEIIKYDNRELERYVYREIAKQYIALGKETQGKVPESLTHISQVSLIAKLLVASSNLSEFDQRNSMKKAERFGLTHDIGRINDIAHLHYDEHRPEGAPKKYNSNEHPVAGAEMLKEQGFPQLYIDFALDHHQWGLGLTTPKHTTVEKFAKENIFTAIKLLDVKYGLPGLTAILADLSKKYPDKENPQRPVIAALTEKDGNELIKRQIANGNYAENSEQHQTEELGLQLTLGILAYLKAKYDVNYRTTIDVAEAVWNTNEKSRIKNLWEQTLSEEQNSEPQQVPEHSVA